MDIECEHKQNFLNLISRFIGRIARIQNPKCFVNFLIKAYKRKFKISMDEYIIPEGGYKNFNNFFTRRLKPNIRQIEENIISGVDGLVYDFGEINEDKTIHVKEKHYNANTLTGEGTQIKGSFAVLYLSPANYHRVHASFDMTVESVKHIPGRLKSVRDKIVKRTDNLYCQNERIVISGNSEYGRFYFILVGALVVGKIKLTFDSNLETNIKKACCISEDLNPPIFIKKGEEVGYFEMGSTLILLSEDKSLSKIKLPIESPIRMGQNLV